ncbi:L-aspartate oxidase [Nanoarchaeota archaeon]
MQTDFLVIGSGIAGLSFALKAAKHGKVTVLTKKETVNSNTNYAQGGVAAVLSRLDNYKLHKQDTIKAGDGLCDVKVVDYFVKHAPKQVRELINFGVHFERDRKHHLKFTREACHSTNRIVYAGDHTGLEIEKSLIKKARANKNINLVDNALVTDLVIHKNSCIGAKVLDEIENKSSAIFSKVVLLCAGGLGNVFLQNTNPGISTGDGYAIAHLAGAKVQDMEFVQFHPTKFDMKTPEPFLISETLRGEGGILRNNKNKAFMINYTDMKELAPRDVVARAIYSEMKSTGKGVKLDMTHLNKKYLKKRFPTIYKKCSEYKIDLTKKQIPVTPAAHYMCGGVKTDINARTSVRNLYAFGEVACTGLHGANRLASNSLIEAVVFADAAVKDIVKRKLLKKILVKKEIKLNKIAKNNIKQIENKILKIQSIMWQKVGIVRNDKDLKTALTKIRNVKKEIQQILKKGISYRLIEARNIAICAELITMSAIKRKESRGTHYNTNHLKKTSKWKKHIIL